MEESTLESSSKKGRWAEERWGNARRRQLWQPLGAGTVLTAGLGAEGMTSVVWLGEARQAGNGRAKQAGMNNKALSSPEEQAENGNLARPGPVCTAAARSSHSRQSGSRGKSGDRGGPSPPHRGPTAAAGELEARRTGQQEAPELTCTSLTSKAGTALSWAEIQRPNLEKFQIKNTHHCPRELRTRD